MCGIQFQSLLGIKPDVFTKISTFFSQNVTKKIRKQVKTVKMMDEAMAERGYE